MNKKTVIEKLSHDVIEGNIYDMFEIVGVKDNTENPKAVFGEKKSNKYDECLNDISEWLRGYVKLNKKDRICVSDIFVTSTNDYCTHGVIHIVNGLNGNTRVSRQSLKHIMDFMTYLEDFYGARAWISSVSMHSDVFYYTVSFVIWGENVDNLEKYWKRKEYKDGWFGNLKPLSHWR